MKIVKKILKKNVKKIVKKKRQKNRQKIVKKTIKKMSENFSSNWPSDTEFSSLPWDPSSFTSDFFFIRCAAIYIRRDLLYKLLSKWVELFPIGFCAQNVVDFYPKLTRFKRKFWYFLNWYVTRWQKGWILIFNFLW